MITKETKMRLFQPLFCLSCPPFAWSYRDSQVQMMGRALEEDGRAEIWDGYEWEAKNPDIFCASVKGVKTFKMWATEWCVCIVTYWKALAAYPELEREWIVCFTGHQMLSSLEEPNFSPSFTSLCVAHQGHQQEAAPEVSAWKLRAASKEADTARGDRWCGN